MFENMKNSWYPEASRGDLMEEDLQKLLEPSQDKALTVKKERRTSGRKLSISRLGLKKTISGLEPPQFQRRESASVMFSIRLSMKSSQKSLDGIIRTGSKQQDPSRIDTIPDLEAMLMANEDFVRYLGERHKHLPQNALFGSPPAKQLTIKKTLAFGTSPKHIKH